MREAREVIARFFAGEDWCCDVAWEDLSDETREGYGKSAAAILAALAAAGLAVVPREATREMRVAANATVCIRTPDGTWSIARDEAARTWRAMLAAAEGQKDG